MERKCFVSLYGGKMKRKKYLLYTFALILSILFALGVIQYQNRYYNKEILRLSKQTEEEFRAMKLDGKQMEWFRTHQISNHKRWLKEYEIILKDTKIFPVKPDTEHRAGWCYENSWKENRTYGGIRFHEGTDIIADNNKRGYFKVVSVSDGVVEKKGWLEKGGWRIGVRSPNGVYYYYAHLYDYAKGIEVGSKIHAGDVIGSMGDSGYSPIEGTVGNFCVHLHFGIYIDIDGEEKSVNPYWILKGIE